MAAVADDPLAARMAADVTRDLTDGLAKIETIRVMLPSGAATSADYVVSSDLEKTETAWNLRARMTEPATGAVKWATSLSIDRTDADAQLQQTRLTAGMGHPLALRINALLKAGERAAEGSPTGTARVAIEQATASINHTTLERFRAALAILEKTLADDPDNVDLQVALAAFQLRGIQMVWFPAAEREMVENRVGAIMARALRLGPITFRRWKRSAGFCRRLTSSSKAWWCAARRSPTIRGTGSRYTSSACPRSFWAASTTRSPRSGRGTGSIRPRSRAGHGRSEQVGRIS
ncbi:hypothetical protein [Mesorhizobium sp.]|uniref:hypothetical protein n=1 Tax=Mesorhizobium sp. TaxID=1871066 RepID=UPI000FE79C15|nr:hypothetical protein [Mesorhizobium sp.]RWA79179.1 MAG: hypothetical protein EOQ30_27025 [Mesorhizobium sp.]